MPGLCFGEDANVAGVSVQVCQSSSPGEAFVRATAPVPGQAGCTYGAPELELWASQNAGPERLLVLGPDSDLKVFVYDTGFDVVNGPITVEVTRASHSSVVICE
ncbi:hypothetical protein [Dermatobacter hominis]|uniref:hypothetical protein n=1 Tax=Dermatobacter hominis TaxID=2884263 RepID=UPI001D12A92A|nr:hypothetical protein [Dermatobacter hominis]UDY34942.1 hypothetical protein LH044_16585 [Dermatobacter hominis]